MIRILSVLYVILLGLWAFCSGIHWADAFGITILAIIGASIVLFAQHPIFSRLTKSPDRALLYIYLTPFQGFGPLGWMLIFMILLSLCSIIPLPLSILSVLSPKSAALYAESDTLANLGNSSTWGYLTAAPGKTAYALVMLCGFLGIYLMTAAITCERIVMNRLMRSMAVAAACIVAMLALRYAGFDISFGPTGQISPLHIGLPVNPNHTSGVMALMALMALGTSFSQRHHEANARRGIWLLVYVAFSFALIMLKSRGAILGWALGHIVLFAGLWLSKHRIELKHSLIVFACLFALIVAVVFVSAPVISSLKAEFEETPITFDTEGMELSADDDIAQKQFSKTQMYGDFWQMSKDWGRTGTGRSAFADIYPQYQSFPFSKRFRHAENEYWEIILEYGWICGLIILILGFAGILCIIKTFLKHPDERASIYGLIAGVIALLIQNCFDFNLRYWTVALPFWISCGILEGRRKRWQRGKPKVTEVSLSKSQTIRMSAGYIILIIGTITVIATNHLWRDGITESGIRKLTNAVTQQNDPEKVRQVLYQNFQTRPASTEIRTIMGEKLLRDAHIPTDSNQRLEYYKKAYQWYSSANKLSPHNPYTMLHLAKLCMAIGDESCAIKLLYRVADENPNLRAIAMNEAAALNSGTLYLPATNGSIRVLIAALLNNNRPETAQKLIQDIPDDIEHKPLIAELSYQLYNAIDFPEGCDLVAELVRDYPVTPAIFRIRAQAFIQKQQYDQLFKYFETTQATLGNDEEYWRLRLYYSVFYGKAWDIEWYKHDIPQIFLQYRNTAGNTAKYRFYLALCDAKYALELDQNNRALRSAKLAIELRPHNKLAQSIYREAEKRSNNPAIRPHNY